MNSFPLLTRSLAVLLIVVMVLTPPAGAATLVWDIATGDGATITGGTGTWTNGAGNWNSGTTNVNWNNATPDSAIFGGTAGTVTLGGAVTVGNMTFNAGTGNYTIAGGGNTLTLANSTITANTLATISAVLGGTTGLIKDGSDTLVLTGTNTYTGATTINAGTLQIGNGSTTGALATSGSITTNGTLVFNRSDTITQGTHFTSAAITGTGSLTHAGTGILALGVANSYSGGTRLTGSGGIIQANISDAFGSGTVTIDGGRRIELGSGVTLSNAFNLGINTGAAGGGLIQNTSGISTVSGAITITSNTTGGGHLASYGTQLNVTGTITSSVAVNVRAGTVFFSGGGTGYNTLQVAGTAKVGATNGIATSALVNLGTSLPGNLDLNGFNQSLRGIAKFDGTNNAATIGNSSTTSDSVLTTTGTSTFPGVIQDTLDSGTRNVSLTVNGGSLTLTGPNTYTGATTVSAGILNIQNATSLGNTAGNTTVSNGATLQLQGGITVGAEALSLNGGGASGQNGALVNVSGTNTYGGVITLTSSSSISAASGSVLNLTGGVIKNGTVATFKGGGTINVGTVAISGASANSDLVIDGVTVNLDVANTYNGPTIIRNSGTLNANVLGALPTATRSALTFDGSGTSVLTLGADQSVASLTSAGAATVTLNANTLTLGAASGSTNFAGIIGGTGSLIKDGASTQILSGVNTFTGVTTVSGGILSVATIGNGGVAGNLGQTSNAAGNLVLNNGTLQYTGADASTDRAFTLTAGATGTFDITTNSLTVSGASATTTGALTKTGAGTLTLSGANGYTGSTTVAAGTLRATTSAAALGGGILAMSGGSLVLANDTALAFDRNTTVSANTTITSDRLTSGVGVNQTLGTLSMGAQTLSLAAGSNVSSGTAGLIFEATTLSATGATFSAGSGTQLTLGAISRSGNSFTVTGAGSTLITGVISSGDGVAGAGTFTKEGAGTLTLTSGSTFGDVNVLDMTTSVSSGILRMGSGANYSLRIGSEAIGTLNVSGGSVENLNGNLGGLAAGNGTANVSGGTWTNSGFLRVGATGIGVLNVTGGSVYVNTAGSEGSTLGYNSGSNGTATVSAGTWATPNNYLTVGRSGSGTLNVTGGSVSNTNGFIGQNTGAVGTVTVSGGTWANSGNLTVGISGTGVLTISGSGGSGGLVSVGGTFSRGASGTLNLNSGGTLQIGNGGTGGVLSGNLFTNGGTLAFNRSNDSTYAGAISGTGSLAKLGAGTLTLSSANTYTGSTTVSFGTLQIGAGGTTGSLSSSSAITNNGTLAFNRSDTITQGTAFNSVISGTGALTQAGSGTLVLSGTNTYTGATTVSAGTLLVTGSIASSSLTTINGGTLMGTGTLGAIQLNSAGTVNLGVGTLSTGNIAITDGQLVFSIGGTGSYGQLTTSGTVNLTNGGSGAQLAINAVSGYTAQLGDSFTLIVNDLTDAISGYFIGLTEGQKIANFLGSALAGKISYLGGTGNDVVLMVVYQDPTVSSLTPSSGSTSGGTSVTITGTDFTGTTGVTIGGAAATSVTVVNSTTITAVTPAGTAGTASVIVITSDGSNAANALYTYNTPPTLADVSKSGLEDTTVIFDFVDFTTVFSDDEGDSLDSITVETLPGTGVLQFFGSNISASQVIASSDLNALTYAPAPNESGDITFTVTASDGTSSSAPATVTMTLAEVNDTPTLDGGAGNTWVARDGSRFWSSVAGSSDGTKLVASARFGERLYTSTDSGTTWTARDSNRDWISVASSADGTKLVALDQGYPSGGSLYTSTDSGVTWTARSGAGTHVWNMVASSADGTKLLAAHGNGQLLTSTDSGETWTARASSENWFAVASSSDGTKLAAAVQGGGLYTSTDSGVNWTLRSGAGTRDFKSIASSADGTKLVVAANGDQLLTSNDSGVTWTFRDSARWWVSVASSSDGVNLLACENGGYLYVSSDSGVTWKAKDSIRSWNGVAVSGDGLVMVAAPAGDNLYVSSAILLPLTISEDAGEQTVNLSGISSGASNESQTLTVTAASNNTSIIPNPTVTYTSANATGSLSFSPVANANGVATITVTVTDDANAGGAALTTSQTFTVTVTAVNDTPTDIALSATTIAENNAANATVGILSTTDVDLGDTFTYTLVSGTGSTDNNSFIISGTSLNLTPSADYETQSSYSVRVRTTDAGGLFYEEALTISITNVNETPVITSNGGGATASISVAENTTTVTTVTASDPEVPSLQTLTYSKTGADAALFTISSSTGVITFTSAPNYEQPLDAGSDNVYDVTVTASDNGTPLISASQNLSITVTDVAEVQRDVSNPWTQSYGGVNASTTRRNGDARAVVVQQSAGSAVAAFATGFTTNAAGNKDIYTVCYNPATGAVVWEKLFDGAAGGHDEGSALAVDSSGDLIVTGYSTNASGNTDVITVKYAHSDGTQIWQKIYAGSGNGADVGLSLAVDVSNNVAVAGYGTRTATGLDVFGARYASDGSTLFEVLVDGGSSSTDLAVSVAVDSAGNLLAAGYATISGNAKDLLVVKLSAAAGASLWTWTANGISNVDDQAYSVAVGAADEVFVTGSIRNNNYDIYLAKLSSAGVAQWSQQWNSPANSSDASFDVTLDGQGNLILAGHSYTAPGVQDGYLAKYNSASGALLWDFRFDGPASGNDTLRSVGVDKENNLVATGYSQNASGTYDAVSLKLLGVDGGLLWTQRYNGAGNLNDEGRSVAVTDDGQAFVAGYATSTGGTTDFLVTSYSAAVQATQTAQSITFANPGAQNAGTPLALSASADSGLTVRFTVVSGSATFDSSSNMLNFTGSGSVTVRASQSGNSAYAAASAVDQTFTVNKSSQTISFLLPATLNSTAQWPLTGVASSGLAVTYNVQSGPGTITGGVLSFSGTGDVTVRASQAGDGRFNAAVNVDAVVTSQNQAPVIIFDNIVENWRDTYAGSGAGAGNDIALQLSGNDAVAGFVAGYTTTTSTGKDLYLAKYLADGTLVWSFASGASGDDEALSVVVDGNGDVVVAGYVTGTGRDLYMAKHNGVTGSKMWDYTYSGTGSGNDVGVSLALDGTTNVVVGGYAVGSGTSNDFFAAKLNLTTGALVWASVRNRTGATSDVPAKVAVGTDGSVAIAGATNSDAWTVKLAAADGTLVWQNVYNFLNKPDAVRGLALDAANNVIITAYSQGSNYDIYTAKYASLDGTLIWGKRYNSSFNSSDHPWDLAVDEDSNVYVTGASYRAASIRDGMTLKYAGLDGSLLWEGRYNGTSSANDENYTISLDGIGNPVISGYTTNSDGSTDVYLAKHNKVPGTIRWQNTFDGANNKNDSIQKVRVDPNGNVWMAGSATGLDGKLVILVLRHMPTP